MKLKRAIRDAIAVAVIAIACAGVAVSPALERVHGLSLDFLTALTVFTQGCAKPCFPMKVRRAGTA